VIEGAVPAAHFLPIRFSATATRASVTVVVDASVVVATLVDSGSHGEWAETQLSSDQLAATHLMPVEAASILRRAARSGEISEDTASMAYADLMELRVALFPYQPFAARIWELRQNVTTYDAWYVALAESLGACLVTLDRRLSRVAGGL
jgi:predicted nucleic acid-binding protein